MTRFISYKLTLSECCCWPKIKVTLIFVHLHIFICIKVLCSDKPGQRL